MNSKKILILAICALFSIGLGVVLSQTFYKQPFEDWTIERKLQGKSEGQKIFRELKEIREKNKDKAEEAGVLVSLAFEWKSLGDLTRDNFYYQKALELYEIGIEKYGTKNVPFYWNAGKVAELMDSYSLAEKYYKEAIRVAPVYSEGYQYLTELYQFKIDKTPAEILAVYAEGLKATQGEANLYLSQCSYLKKVDKKKAIECYQVLVDTLPQNQIYKDEIEQLKKEN